MGKEAFPLPSGEVTRQASLKWRICHLLSPSPLISPVYAANFPQHGPSLAIHSALCLLQRDPLPSTDLKAVQWFKWLIVMMILLQLLIIKILIIDNTVHWGSSRRRVLGRWATTGTRLCLCSFYPEFLHMCSKPSFQILLPKPDKQAWNTNVAYCQQICGIKAIRISKLDWPAGKTLVLLTGQEQSTGSRGCFYFPIVLWEQRCPSELRGALFWDTVFLENITDLFAGDTQEVRPATREVLL